MAFISRRGEQAAGELVPLAERGIAAISLSNISLHSPPLVPL